MTKNRMNPKVDSYFSKPKEWQEEFEKLRMIVLDCGLTEELSEVFLVTRFRKET